MLALSFEEPPLLRSRLLGRNYFQALEKLARDFLPHLTEPSLVLSFAAASAASLVRSQYQTEARAFSGKITESNGKYVLEGLAWQTPFALDDQKAAKKYDGKSVIRGGVNPRSPFRAGI